MEDPDDPTSSHASLFVDRVSESEALRRSLEQHRERMDRGYVDARTLRNVLVFYGEGGVGKTALSQWLAGWLQGDGQSVAHWGPTPPVPVDAVVRWDANDSRGGLDPLPLLIGLRSSLGAIRRSWPAFDLPFALYHRSLRPGQELELRTPRRGLTTLTDVAGGLGGDLFALTGTALTGAAGAGAMTIGRNVLAALRERRETARLLAAYPGLDDLILACENLSGSTEDSAVVAGRLAFMITRELEAMGATDPSQRPLIVVFVDHMERLQVPGDQHLGEATLNRLVSRLPYCLFVVTGRRSLRWHEVSPSLPASGPNTWPLLSTEHPPPEEPGQHAIGNLSDEDATELLEASFARHGVKVVQGLNAYLATKTDGWPLHLNTIVALARERRDLDRPLNEEDLGGPLEHLVERLLRDLPPDVAKAFRAACLLPFFDVRFVAASGGMDAGSVERLLSRQIVRRNGSSTYPYRIHDELRKIVRAAGSSVQGGWGEVDWERHAGLASAEAERRFEEAMDAEDDLGAIRSLALGLNVATENNLFDPWLVDAIRRSPSIKGLASLIAADPDPDAGPDLRDTLQFLRLRARATRDDVADGMEEIFHRGTAISTTAGVWRAYDLRKWGREDEAIAQFEELLRHYDDRPALYRYQLVTSFRIARRYRDALDRFPMLSEDQKVRALAATARVHGHYQGAAQSARDRYQAASSRRFQIELLGDLVIGQHREYGIDAAEVRASYQAALTVGHSGAQADCLGVLAEMHLEADDVFDACIAELERLSALNFQPYRALPQALAVRAYATGDDTLARRAHAIAARTVYRSSIWTSTEILLEALGHPLDPVESQWLEPYADVRDRWMHIHDSIIERTRRQTL